MTIDTSAWDETQLDPLSPPPEDFDGMTVDEAVEVIEAWFLENFERPGRVQLHAMKEIGSISGAAPTTVATSFETYSWMSPPMKL